jgi:tetratricopeptide (TPR) repeat protein
VTGINPDFITWLQKMVAPNLKDRYGNAAMALQELRSIDISGQAKLRPTNDNLKYLMICLVGLTSGAYVSLSSLTKTTTTTVTNQPILSNPSLTAEQEWFNQIKPSCNSVEVVTAMKAKPYFSTPQGVGFGASCYALAGKIALADQAIQQLPVNTRGYAAAIVFDIGHPVADAGDDKSAGPIMEMVVKYWPGNYMALYHAGMSSYVLGDYPKATQQLQEFLKIYQQPDGWTAKAKNALDRMEKQIPADKSFSMHEG